MKSKIVLSGFATLLATCFGAVVVLAQTCPTCRDVATEFVSSTYYCCAEDCPDRMDGHKLLGVSAWSVVDRLETPLRLPGSSHGRAPHFPASCGQPHDSAAYLPVYRELCTVLFALETGAVNQQSLNYGGHIGKRITQLNAPQTPRLVLGVPVIPHRLRFKVLKLFMSEVASLSVGLENNGCFKKQSTK